MNFFGGFTAQRFENDATRKWNYNKTGGINDPQGRPTVTDGSDHCVCTCRPSVRLHFSKQNKFQAKTMFATGETVGLAEWIIVDTRLVYNILILILFYTFIILPGFVSPFLHTLCRIDFFIQEHPPLRCKMDIVRSQSSQIWWNRSHFWFCNLNSTVSIIFVTFAGNDLRQGHVTRSKVMIMFRVAIVWFLEECQTLRIISL